MKIYKFEYVVNDGNQHDWYKPRTTHVLHVLENSRDNRDFFSDEVGVYSEDFLLGGSAEYFGYKITEIEVIE